MNDRCLACGAECDGDVCDTQCEQVMWDLKWAKAEAEEAEEADEQESD